MKKRVVSLCLILSMLLTAMPTFLLPSLALDGARFESVNAESFDYDSLYVEGAVLRFDFYDKDSKDELPADGVLYEDKESGVKVSLSNIPTGGLHYGNGYLLLTGGAALTASGVSAVPSSEATSVENTHQILLSRLDEMPVGNLNIPSEKDNATYLFRFGSLKQFEAFRAGGIRFALSYITKENAELQREYHATVIGAKNNASQQIGFSYPVRPAELAVLKGLNADAYITTNNGPGEEQASWAGFSYLISNTPYANYGYYYKCTATIPDSAFRSGVCKNVVYFGSDLNAWATDIDTLSANNQGRTFSARDYGESYTLTTRQSATYTAGTQKPYTWNLNGFFVDAEATVSTAKTTSSGAAPTSAKDLVLSNYPSKVYAIRAYDKLLSEEEIIQNLFADVAKYFELDLTDYLALDEEKQALIRADVASSIALHSTQENAEAMFDEIMEPYKPFEPDEYEKLYVTDADGDGESDLLFFWDAFSLTEGGVTPGAIMDKYGRHSIPFSSGTAGNGSFDTTMNIDFSSVIPKDKNGDYPDLTIELSMKPIAPAASGKRVSPKFILGPVQTLATTHVDEAGIFSSLYRAYRTADESTVTYFFGADGKVLKKANGSACTAEKDVTAAGLTYANKVSIPAYTSEQLAIGENWMQPKTYFYNPAGESYSLHITLDFTVSDTEKGIGSMKMVLGRDGAVAATKSNYSYFRGYTDSSAVSVPATFADAQAMLDQAPYENMVKEEDKASFIIGGNGASVGYHAFRVYDAVLSEKQINQNHFADLVNFYRPDLSCYEMLDTATKEAFFADLATVQYDEIDAPTLEKAILDAYIDQYFDGVSIGSFVSFDGFQIKLYGDDPALRARFTLDKAALASLGDEYTVESLGIIAAEADGTEITDLKLTANAEGKYTVVPEGMHFGEAYGEAFDRTFKAEDGKSHFAFALSYEGEDAVGLDYIKSYRFRAYMVLTRDKGTEKEVTVVQYCDALGDESGVGEEASLSEMSMILKEKGSDSPLVKAVCQAIENLDGDILAGIEKQLAHAQENSEDVLARYESMLAEYESYRTQITAQQAIALKAKTDAALSAAKSAAQKIVLDANASYQAIEAYIEGEEKQASLDTAKSLYDQVIRLCGELASIADEKGDAALKAMVEEKLAEAESYYQGLCRVIADCELTLSRYNRKISNSYSALSKYTVKTKIKSRMYILGDSTVCPRDPSSGTQGWPQMLAPYLNDEIEIVNYAVGSWSFKGMIYTSTESATADITLYTDMENSRFGKVLDVAGEGDFVVFASTSPNDIWQYGRDFFYTTDEFGNVAYAVKAKDASGNTVHYFDDAFGNRIYLTKDNCAKYGYTMYTWKANPNEYYHMLKECIDKTLATGATPILVTACGGIMTTTAQTKSFTITRDGVDTTYQTSVAIPGKVHSNVESHEEVKRILAEEYGDRVVLIDYAPLVFEEYEKDFDQFIKDGMSKDDALIALRVKYNPGKDDPTHQNPVGAQLACDKMLEILRDEAFDCDLKQYLKSE